MKKLTTTIYFIIYASAFFIFALISCADKSGTLTDIDGNVYRTVKIGSQVWMAENLKVTHYRNGDPVTYLKEDEEWRAVMLNYTPAYCNYKNDEKFVKTYGRLYNWYA
ncbi:MAG: fibrobacter succinogenes major paralogous domain-containing protein, partial [Spirochaetes bacterium]|nr:fibrobacter succinogenes major paralogous domain-containing protein [Spirochaetota bacterium]